MNVTNSTRTNRTLLSLFRRSERWREIPPGYHVGDVRSDIPIAILADARVVGNVFAPKILVEGLLYGSAVALEITIESSGQIWGDVYSGRLQVEPGGKLQGWVSNLDETTLESMQVDGLIPDELQERTVELSQLPAEAVESGRLARGENQINVLRRLQMESAAALAARDELERTFEKRLSETASEATARAASLHEELSKLRLDLTNLREERDELREELRERTAQVERQANEIITARELITGRTDELESLQQQHEKKLEELAALLQAKNALDNEMLEANKQVDALTDRTRSIESALQNSLQHASEQEESLIRWQELAEVTETKVQTLQAEIDNLKFQAAENSRLNEMLRAQRKHAEDAWQEAVQELEQLRQKETTRFIPPDVMTELENQIIQLKADLERAEAQSKADRLALADQTAKMQAQHEAKLARLEEKYESKLGQVQEEAAQAKQELQRSKELMLWDKATLDTTQTALAQAQADLDSRQTVVTHLQNELQAKQSELESVHTQLVRQQAVEASLNETIAAQSAELTARGIELSGLQQKLGGQATAVTQLHQDIANFQATLSQLKEENAANKMQFAQTQEKATLEASELRDRLRETRTQLEAQEAETENYFQQMEKQGQRLAEIQATLIERELAVSQLKETAEKQKALINRMKEVTTERMNKLNNELSETRQQLKQALALVHKLKGGK